MRRAGVFCLLIALPAIAGGADVPREPFANAHVSLMARVQKGGADAQVAELDVWAEGTRLRARVRGDARGGDLWLEGLASRPLLIVGGKVEPVRRKTLEQALQLAFAPSPILAHANTDRIAGRPCKRLAEQVSGGATLTRCIWRGLPLSVELKMKGFSFHAAATLVEEGTATPADLQPPPGAPAAPDSLSAVR
jgi:hypothetical protein